MEFDKELYDRQAIFQAVRDYAALAAIDVYDLGGSWSCVFSNCRYHEELTQREFANYVLEMTAQRKMG